MGYPKSPVESSVFLPAPAPRSRRALGCYQQHCCAAPSPPRPPMLPAQEQFGVVLVFQVLFDEVREQLLQHVGGVLQLALQTRHDERGHVATIAHGEAALQLQRSDEGQQEDFVVDQLSKELQGLLHALLPVPLDLRWRGA